MLSAMLRCCRSYIAAVLDILDPEGDIFGQRVIAGHGARFKTLDRVMLLTMTLAFRSTLLHPYETEVAACCYPTLASMSKYNRARCASSCSNTYHYLAGCPVLYRD